jgi:hypothetical protein
MTLWELSLLLFAILMVGGLVWMSINNNARGSLNRKNIDMASKRPSGGPNIHRKGDVEIAEEVTPPHSQKIFHEEEQEEHRFLPKIPYAYGGTYINAMARDPFWIFAYWEVSESTMEDIRRRYGFNAWESSRPVLKVYDTTDLYFFDSRQAFEIQINDLASSWYINVGQPNHSYFIELGRILPDGTYIFIARSNMVTTPRLGVSDVVDLEWMVPTEYEKRIYGMHTKANGSPDFIEEMAQKAAVTKIEQEHISSPMNW